MLHKRDVHCVTCTIDIFQTQHNSIAIFQVVVYISNLVLCIVDCDLIAVFITVSPLEDIFGYCE